MMMVKILIFDYSATTSKNAAFSLHNFSANKIVTPASTTATFTGTRHARIMARSH
jgi:hypothetical protein